MKNDWEKHAESKEMNHAWIAKTIAIFNKFSGINFLPYRNYEGKIYFIELSNLYFGDRGYQATIVCADDLDKEFNVVGKAIVSQAGIEF